MKKLCLAIPLVCLFFFVSTSVTRAQRDSAVGSVSNIKKQLPLCGVRNAMTGNEQKERAPQARILLQRLAAIQKHTDEMFSWMTKVDSLKRGEKDGGDMLTWFLGKMSVLFDADGAMNKERSTHFLARWVTISPQEIEAWEKSFITISNDERLQNTFEWRGGIIYGVHLSNSQDLIRGEILLTLIAADRLYQGDRYNPSFAAKYRSRLESIIFQDTLDLIAVVPAFKYAWIDAAITLILADDLFDGNKFNRERFKAVLTKT